MRNDWKDWENYALIATGDDFLGDRPKLKAWRESILKTGPPATSAPQDFEEAFANFHL